MVFAAENHSPRVDAAAVVNHKRSEDSDKFDDKEPRSSKENGEQKTNGYERDAISGRSGDRQPDVVEDHPGKSRSKFPFFHVTSLYAYQFFCYFY